MRLRRGEFSFRLILSIRPIFICVQRRHSLGRRAQRSSRPAAATSRAGKSGFARGRSLPRRLSADAQDGHAVAGTGMVDPNVTDHADRSRREPSLRPTSGTGGRRRAPTAAAVRHDRYAGHAAGRRRARPTVGGPPDSIRQRAAQVLIAAILHPTIRGARITTGGACRAWALLKRR